MCYMRVINRCLKKLTSEQTTRIQQLRSVGYPMATIAKLFGVERSVVAVAFILIRKRMVATWGAPELAKNQKGKLGL